ncbi:hypothetical protein LNN35_21425 [Pseudomonas stutzeri]|uniref:hypothetical protein n=1 Tax=Stutzerimonas stutzeri TaxID=316 RepID=UPI001E320F78|nr:hypothetical protein [Stutzerimonas stutzeri]MCC8345327.1 hypothetical protein [Stutzerimonas stutzeri]
MSVLVEFVIFIFALPALFLYLFYTMLYMVADFFGWSFIPGVMGIHIGVTLFVLGQPDPGVQWESIFQTLAGIEVVGMPLPLVLVCAGVTILVIGAAMNIRNQTAR